MSKFKIIGVAVLIAVVGIVAGLGIRAVMGRSGSSSGVANKDIPGDAKGFAWGITMLTFPFPTYVADFTDKQIAEADELGVNYLRIDYSPSNPGATEKAVQAALDKGMRVVLVIPFGPKDIFTDKDLEKNTTSYVTNIVTRFKGKVAVYQLATEVASVSLKNNASLHGIELKDYPTASLSAVTTWVKTAAEAVKQTDPTAKRLVNDQWVHTGFFDNYIAKGGEFDILGWNWFSDMGDSMDMPVLDASKNQTYELMTKLKGYGKPIWLTEVNRRMGSQGGKEKDQAAFIKTMTDYVKTQPAIKGFFVFNLLEDQVAPAQEKGYGILTASDATGVQKITGRKPAYDTYKKAIKN